MILLLSVSSMGAKVVFRGGFNEAGDSVCGIFSQGGAKLPLCLVKGVYTVMLGNATKKLMVE